MTGRHPRLGIQWAAPSGAPAPSLYLPLATDLLDDSTNGFTNSSGSVPTIDSGASTPLGTGAAVFAAASNQFLEFADNTALDFGTGDWFISFWALWLSSGNTVDFPVFVSKGSYQSSTGAWSMYNNLPGTRGIYFGYGNPWVEGTLAATGAGPFPANAFNHVYIQRSGNTMSLRTNDVARATLDVTGVNFDNSHVLRIGDDLGGGGELNGQMRDLVICKGSTLTSTQITSLQTSPYSSLL